MLGPYKLDSIITGDARELALAIPDESVDLFYTDMMFDDSNLSWLNECVRILKVTGSLYIHTDYRSVAQVKLYLDNLLSFQNWIVWCYKACPPKSSIRRYQRKHDDILFYTRSADNYTWNRPVQPPSKRMLETFKVDDDGKILNPSPAMKKRSMAHYVRDVTCRDWWDDISIKYACWDTGGRRIHKWQKPEKLVQRIVEASSNPSDVVVDFFIGSGTTGAVCKQTGRRWLGFEIDEQVALQAIDRVLNTRSGML